MTSPTGTAPMIALRDAVARDERERAEALLHKIVATSLHPIDEILAAFRNERAAVFAALREPTEGMLRAGRDANQTIFACGTDPAFIREIAEDTWRAMLAEAERAAATDSPPPATAAD